ncbi:MAG: 3-dehydroquinate synthase [Candidatus Eremiobacteraeota bacterium]|nr:3-dehydroquinate synthase [Candidatus Eremiobacteraeota bacterium]
MLLRGLAYPIAIAADAPAVMAALLSGLGREVLVAYDRRVKTRAAAFEAALRARSVSVLGSHGMPSGERIKRMQEVVGLHDWLIERAADRRCLLLAVGGGCLTDVVGFAAATFLRGITWAAAPTTLVGMVDAGIGGKTGVNMPQGKNLVGAFWDPAAVVADLAALVTLPIAQRRNGIAEIVKAAVIGDPALLDAVDRVAIDAPPAAWKSVIARAARVKVGIVAADPRERETRAGLNLGHTLGHGFEFASGFRLSHGAAVAVGMRGAGLLAMKRGVWSQAEHARVLRSLLRAGLPLYLPSLDPERVFEGVGRDKKRVGGQIRFTLPLRLGLVRHDEAVTAKEMRDAIACCLRKPARDELRW